MAPSRSGRALGRGLFAAATAVSLLATQLTVRPASAEPTAAELDKARAMFLEGVSLAAANNCAAALTKYQAVLKVKMTAQVTFNIAECEERLGKLVSALGSYRLAASLVTDNKPVEVSAHVGDRIKSVEDRIPRLVIQRTEQTSRIELDGVEIGSSQFGQENFVDPGAHVVSGKIGETEVWRETVTLAEKEQKTITVKIDIDKFKPPTKPTATATTDVTAPPTSTAPPVEPPSKVPGFVIGGAGVLALGVGAALMGVSLGTAGDLEKTCGTDHICPADQKAKYDSGRTTMGAGEVLAGLGIVGAAVGVILVVRASGAPKPAPAQTGVAASQKRPNPLNPEVGVSLTGGAGTGGLSVVGRF